MDDSKRYDVKELDHFPFDSMSELLDSITRRQTTILADRVSAVEVFSRDPRANALLKILSMFLGWTPFIVPIAVIVYTLITGNWLSLISIPLVFLEITIFNPGRLKLFPLFALMVKLLVVALLLYGVMSGATWITCMTLALIVIWFANKLFFTIAVSQTIKLALKYEEKFCILWKYNAIFLKTSDGDFVTSRGRFNPLNYNV